MPSLSSGQYQLTRDDGSNALTYGRGASSIQVVNTAYSPGTMVVQDQSVVGHDGVLFGVDTQAGAVITQTGQAMTTPATGAYAMDAFDALSAAWNDPVIRLADNRYQILRLYYPGSAVVRRVYGRGRAITPGYGQVFQGLMPWTAQFQCADNNVYEDIQNVIQLQMIPNLAFPAPFKPPGVMQPAYLGDIARITIGGTVPTWPVITISGPVTNPQVTFTGTPVFTGYNGSLASGQSLVVDTRPWARTFMIGAASAAGGMTGTPLIGMQLWPGTTTVQLSGTPSRSGIASATIAWYNATQSLGGSY
jgi:hypothetical protein